MVRVKAVYVDSHNNTAAVSPISAACRVHMIYTIARLSVTDEQSLRLYDEVTDSGTSMDMNPSVNLRVPKDAAFSWCKDVDLSFGFGLVDFKITIGIDSYDSPSGIVWKAPRGGIIFKKGVSILSDNAGSMSTVIIYSDMGRQRQKVA